MKFKFGSFARAGIVAIAVLLTVSAQAWGVTPGVPIPAFSKAFQPATIGPGSTSTLVFTIDNGASAFPVTGLAFTDALPAGVTIQTPAVASTTCIDGALSAPDGGSTIALAGASLAPSASCTVTVDVTSATPGIHMNVSSALASSAGSSGPATADLTVATDRPGFAKSFSPGAVVLGSRSTLTFTIDNTSNAAQASFLAFTDSMPTGMVVADPANASNTCADGPFLAGVLTAVPGTGTISLGSGGGLDVGAVGAGATCTVAVDVIGSALGMLDNVSGELTSSAGFVSLSSGKASASLDVSASEVALIKSFTDDPVPPGGTVTLDFSILNFNRTDTASSIGFSDDLDATLTGLAPSSPLPATPCGASSSLAFSAGTLTLSGGTLLPEGSCTFSISLAVPAAATPGIYPNTTSGVAFDFGVPQVGLPASDDLFVFAAPLLTKTFLDTPVTPGASTRMEFTITNTSLTSSATDIAFIDELTTFLPFPVSVTLPATPCGAGSSVALVSLGTDRQGLSLTGGTLGPGLSCTFEVTLDLPLSLPSAIYTNTTGAITATVDATTVTGNPASADLEVVAAPSLTKSFTDDPVTPGSLVTLEFTLANSFNAPASATAITFTDDLSATLTGLTAVGLPLNDICGTGSQISGTGLLSFTGGTLAPGASCTFSVTLQVPTGAVSGAFPNTTSDVTATVSGLVVTSNPAQDTLTVAQILFTKTFIGEPAIPGDAAILRFSIANMSTTADATGMFFIDNLNAALSGLVAEAPLPATPCGAGSSITGTSLLIFTGGDLLAGTSCTFDVTVRVPAGAPSGTFTNITSSLSVTLGGSLISVAPAVDGLTVSSDLLAFTKTFLSNPVFPGNTVNLEFTVTNLDATRSASAIGFTDDLGAALAGLTAVGLPLPNICGAGSSISGTTLLTFTGGILPAAGSCTFQVTVQVPAMPAATSAVNTTSTVAGTINGFPVSGSAASDTLNIQSVVFSKAFDAPTFAGGMPTLSFTIENLSTTASVSGLGFTDDLNAVLPGLVAVGLPSVNPCGAGSLLVGTSFLSFSGASLGPAAMCTFSVTLQVPAGAPAGSFVNTTSALSSSGLTASAPAVANLIVALPPGFSKVFGPPAIAQGGVSTLTLTIDNAANAFTVAGLAFTDTLPASVVVASPSNASTDCGSGSVTAVAGSSAIALAGGSVTALGSCTVTADVTSTAAGSHLNSVMLQTDLGPSGPAQATLVVASGIGFSKAFLGDPVLRGGLVDLEYTISNPSAVAVLQQIAFTDDLNTLVPGLVAVGLPANDVCGLGSQLTGTGIVAFTGGVLGAGASCTFAVSLALPPNAPLGTFASTTSAITATPQPVPGTVTGGVSGPAASANLTVAFLTIEKTFGPDPVLAGSTTPLTFTITNPDPVNAATAIAFSDDLDAALAGMTAQGLPLADVCGLGSALTGTSVITLAGGNLGPGGSCTFMVSVLIPARAQGTFTNITSSLGALVAGNAVTGDAGSGGVADLQVLANVLAIPTLGTWGLVLLILALMGLAIHRLRLG